MTDTGISVVDGLADRWLAYQQISRQADIELANSERNVTDRIEASRAAAPAAPAMMINWTYVGIAVAAVAGLGLVFKIVKG